MGETVKGSRKKQTGRGNMRKSTTGGDYMNRKRKGDRRREDRRKESKGEGMMTTRERKIDRGRRKRWEK